MRHKGQQAHHEEEAKLSCASGLNKHNETAQHQFADGFLGNERQKRDDEMKYHI
jgi:hypothetical protein